MDADPAPHDDAPPDVPVEDASARVVVARVLGSTGARSAVVVGGSAGSARAWARACRELGVPEVVTVGPSADVSDPGRDDGSDDAIDQGVEHVDADPAAPLDVGGRYFGLAVCVDLAHSLAPDRAAGLVADLTALAPVVLFAAAVPGQDEGLGPGRHEGEGEGEHEHDDGAVRADPPPPNEQWPEHWVGLFEAEGWTCRDAVRPWIRANDDVAWWYRQSLFLAAAPSVERAYSSFPRLGAERPRQPVDYLVRPDGDVMTPPRPPLVPDTVTAATGTDDIPPPPLLADAGLAVPPPTPLAAGAPGGNGAVPPPREGASAATDAPEPPVTSDDAVRADPDDTSTDGTDEELTFPEPPGWATLRRVAGRARRRSGR